MAQEIKMSAAGLKAMQEELEYLKTVRRKELAEEIKEARSHGDLSENSEYDEAKNTQGLVENRITELEQMVKNAVVIDESELSVENVSVEYPSPSRWRARTRPRSTTSCWPHRVTPRTARSATRAPWATPAGERLSATIAEVLLPTGHYCIQLQGAGHHPRCNRGQARKSWKNRRRTPHRACLRASRCRCAARSWQTCRLQAT